MENTRPSTTSSQSTATGSGGGSTSTANSIVSGDSCQQLEAYGSSYVDTNANRTYSIACNSDLLGQGDLAAISSNSFQGCFPLCASEPGCQAFAYLGGVCYLKKIISSNVKPTSPSGADLAYLFDAGVSAPAPLIVGSSCQTFNSTTYNSTNIRTYIIKCGHDELGYGDIGQAASDGFSNCFDLCDKFESQACVGFAYAASTCYFKGSIGHINSNSNVELAYLDSIKPGRHGNQTSTIAMSSSSSTDSTASATPGSCSAVKASSSTYNTSDGTSFSVSCDWDYFGGDYASAQAPNYKACFDICAKDRSCLAFSFASYTCYLKNTAGKGAPQPNVDSGKIVGRKSSQDSSSMASSTINSASLTQQNGNVVTSGSASVNSFSSTSDGETTVTITVSSVSNGASSKPVSTPNPSGPGQSGQATSTSSTAAAITQTRATASASATGTTANSAASAPLTTAGLIVSSTAASNNSMSSTKSSSVTTDSNASAVVTTSTPETTSMSSTTKKHKSRTSTSTGPPTAVGTDYSSTCCRAVDSEQKKKKQNGFWLNCKNTTTTYYSDGSSTSDTESSKKYYDKKSEYSVYPYCAQHECNSGQEPFADSDKVNNDGSSSKQTQSGGWTQPSGGPSEYHNSDVTSNNSTANLHRRDAVESEEKSKYKAHENKGAYEAAIRRQREREFGRESKKNRNNRMANERVSEDVADIIHKQDLENKYNKAQDQEMNAYLSSKSSSDEAPTSSIVDYKLVPADAIVVNPATRTLNPYIIATFESTTVVATAAVNSNSIRTSRRLKVDKREAKEAKKHERQGEVQDFKKAMKIEQEKRKAMNKQREKDIKRLAKEEGDRIDQLRKADKEERAARKAEFNAWSIQYEEMAKEDKSREQEKANFDKQRKNAIKMANEAADEAEDDKIFHREWSEFFW